jgi:hypothetical protein
VTKNVVRAANPIQHPARLLELPNEIGASHGIDIHMVCRNGKAEGGCGQRPLARRLAAGPAGGSAQPNPTDERALPATFSLLLVFSRGRVSPSSDWPCKGAVETKRFPAISNGILLASSVNAPLAEIAAAASARANKRGLPFGLVRFYPPHRRWGKDT